VLVTSDGSTVGALPPFEVDTPWWQDAEAVVRGARDRLGVAVTILRMLAAEHPGPPGGAVTYLAEVDAPVPAQPWRGVIDDHALRLPWADPGGPERDLRWAASELAARGLRPTGRARQVRSWNLSSIWRLPVEGQTGHPLLDAAAFLDRIPAGDVPAVRAHWDRAWRPIVPGSEPERALQLLAPVAAARQAVIYRVFLDGIEPSEHPYHRADPADWLRRVASMAGSRDAP
jgi:hypothetical protein